MISSRVDHLIAPLAVTSLLKDRDLSDYSVFSEILTTITDWRASSTPLQVFGSDFPPVPCWNCILSEQSLQHADIKGGRYKPIGRTYPLIHSDYLKVLDFLWNLLAPKIETEGFELKRQFSRSSFDRSASRYLFLRGHQLSRSEQCFRALLTKAILATEDEDFYAREIRFSLLFLSLADSTKLTKEWKAYTTNWEKQMIDDEERKLEACLYSLEPVEVEYQRFFEKYTAEMLGTLQPPRNFTELKLESRYIGIITANRGFPAPDENEMSLAYAKYIKTLTEPEIKSSPNNSEEELFQSHRHLCEDILSGMIHSQMEFYSLDKVPSRLKTVSVCPKSSSTLASTMQDRGHWGDIENNVLPWLVDTKISEAFEFCVDLNEDPDEIEDIHVCDDFGNIICARSMEDSPMWMAFLDETPDCTFGEVIADAKAGIDNRFGYLLHLYATFKTRELREWLESNYVSLDLGSVSAAEAVTHPEWPIMETRTTPVLEPGGKVRWVSVSELAIQYFLMPICEVLRTAYGLIPGCKIGLEGDFHLFRFEQSFASHGINSLIDKKPSAQSFVTRVYGIGEGRGLCELVLALAKRWNLNHIEALYSLDLFPNQAIAYDEARIVDYPNLPPFDALINITEDQRLSSIVCSTADQVSATDTMEHNGTSIQLDSILHKIETSCADTLRRNMF